MRPEVIQNYRDRQPIRGMVFQEPGGYAVACLRCPWCKILFEIGDDQYEGKKAISCPDCNYEQTHDLREEREQEEKLLDQAKMWGEVYSETMRQLIEADKELNRKDAALEEIADGGLTQSQAIEVARRARATPEEK